MNYVIWIHDPENTLFTAEPKSNERVKEFFDGILRPASGGKVKVTALTSAMVSEEAAKTLYKQLPLLVSLPGVIESPDDRAAIRSAHDEIVEQLMYLDSDWLEDQGHWD